MADIKCGKCKVIHHSVAAVKACYSGAATIAPCTELVERTLFDCDGIPFSITEDCGAEAIYTNRGFTCDAGHEYTNMQVRHDEGWDYAEDPEEAKLLIKAGTRPVPIGSSYYA